MPKMIRNNLSARFAHSSICQNLSRFWHTVNLTSWLKLPAFAELKRIVATGPMASAVKFVRSPITSFKVCITSVTFSLVIGCCKLASTYATIDTLKLSRNLTLEIFCNALHMSQLSADVCGKVERSQMLKSFSRFFSPTNFAPIRIPR